MIKSTLNDEITEVISEIERNRLLLENTGIPYEIENELRENARKRRAYFSNKIEGNPLTREQSDAVIDKLTRGI